MQQGNTRVKERLLEQENHKRIDEINKIDIKMGQGLKESKAMTAIAQVLTMIVLIVIAIVSMRVLLRRRWDAQKSRKSKNNTRGIRNTRKVRNGR